MVLDSFVLGFGVFRKAGRLADGNRPKLVPASPERPQRGKRGRKRDGEKEKRQGAAEPLPGRGAARTGGAQHGAHLRDAREGKRVVDLAPAPAVAHDARLAEQREMLADGREAALGPFRQRSHALLPLGQTLHNPQARGVAQRLEDFRAKAEGFVFSGSHVLRASFQHFREY